MTHAPESSTIFLVPASGTVLCVSYLDNMCLYAVLLCIHCCRTEDSFRMKSLTWFLLKSVHYIGHLIVFVTWPVFRWLYNGAQRGLPPVHSDLLMKSGVELAAMIRKRQVCHYSYMVCICVCFTNCHCYPR